VGNYTVEAGARAVKAQSSIGRQERAEPKPLDQNKVPQPPPSIDITDASGTALLKVQYLFESNSTTAHDFL
jgi:hypothetical protein